MRFDNIGLHVERGGVDPQRIRKCPLVVFDECSVEYVQKCREVNPTAWFVVRWWYDVAVQDAMMANPEQAATDWFIRHKADIERLKGTRVVFQGLNEVGDAHNEAHACFERRRIELLHSVGAYGGVGAWSVGCPREDLWPAWVPVLDTMIKGKDALLMHLYWANPNDTHNPWHVARWKLPEVAPYVAGQTILGTEGGRDWCSDSPEGQRGYRGWKRDSDLTDAGYLAEIADAAAFIGVPFVLFTMGDLRDPKWRPYDVTDIWSAIEAEQPEPHATPVVTPTPEPVLRLRSPLDVPFRVSSPFGWRERNGVIEFHKGGDLVGLNGPWSTHGLNVYAMHDGQVFVARHPSGYGMHAYNKGVWCHTLEAHLAEVTVEYGQPVREGDLIGRVGYTGTTYPLGVNGSHLHVGVRLLPLALDGASRGYVDPLPLIQEAA